MLEKIALASGWLLVIMACVTTFDVVARKFGVQLPYTKLQELEWHFHAAIFSLWMGYATRSTPIRASTPSWRANLIAPAWVELVGCLLLALPYVTLVAYFSLDFVAGSYAVSERSDSTVGLTHRWVIKGIFAFGLWLVVLGILSVLLRVIVFLFGTRRMRKSTCRSVMSRRTSSPAKGNHHARLAGRLPLAHHVREHVLLHLHGLSRGLHHGRPGADLRAGRRLSRRLQPHRHLRRRAAHVGRCRCRSGARLDPMFIFMGAILERSGSAKDMLDATEVLMKWCPGALAVSVMVMGTILARRSAWSAPP